MSNVKTNVIIYHADCNDGFGAAWVAYNGLMERGEQRLGITLVPAKYGDDIPREYVDENTNVFVLDFSYPIEKMLELADMCESLVCIDHHKTAELGLIKLAKERENVFVKFSLDHSGAMLAWMYFKGNTAPTLIRYIQDRDLWKFELYGSKEFSLRLNLEEKTMSSWDAVLELTNQYNRLQSWIDSGVQIKRAYDKQLADIISLGKLELEIDGIKGLVCNAPYMFASDIGNTLAKESGTFGATWYEDTNTDAVFSIRSIGEFDVSEIAKRFGGGGHKNAAGFKLKFEVNKVNSEGKPICQLWSNHEKLAILSEYANKA